MCGLGKINPFNIRHGFLHTVAKNPILSKIIPVVATAVGGPLLGAAASGIESYAGGAKPIDALKIAGLSYAGNSIGSSIGGSLFPGTVGDTIGPSASNAIGGVESGLRNAVGAGFGQTASNAILNTSVGGALGGFEGSAIASNLMPQNSSGGSAGNATKSTSLVPPAFTPTRSPQLDLPGSLSGLSNLTPDQQTSNLATQGVYGGGLGGQEQDYFNNLVNHQLVDDSGKTQDISTLSPIENSYLGQLGLGGYSNSKDLLQAMSKWKNQATA